MTHTAPQSTPAPAPAPPVTPLREFVRTSGHLMTTLIALRGEPATLRAVLSGAACALGPVDRDDVHALASQITAHFSRHPDGQARTPDADRAYTTQSGAHARTLKRALLLAHDDALTDELRYWTEDLHGDVLFGRLLATGVGVRGALATRLATQAFTRTGELPTPAEHRA